MTTTLSTTSDISSNSKEFNFKELREKAERLERENAALKSSQSHRELLHKAGISEDDPLVETAKLTALLSEVEARHDIRTEAKIKSILEEQNSQNTFLNMMALTGGQFKNVVTEDALKEVLEAEPELGIVFQHLEKQPAAFSQFAYEKITRHNKAKREREELNTRVDHFSKQARSQSHMSTMPTENIAQEIPNLSGMRVDDIAKLDFLNKIKSPSFNR
jgi:hypothetical protein